jgi:hypothetical protein
MARITIGYFLNHITIVGRRHHGADHVPQHRMLIRFGQRWASMIEAGSGMVSYGQKNSIVRCALDGPVLYAFSNIWGCTALVGGRFSLMHVDPL